MTLPALDQSPVPTRTNRSVLMLLGLVLAVAGVLGLLVGFGGFGASAQRRPVLDPSTRSYAASHDWFWLIVAAAALIVAILALLWLRVQLTTNRVRSFELERDHSHGTTTLAAAAVERACAEELQSRRGIAKATAVVLGSEYDPRLALVVSLDGREPLRTVDHVVLTDFLPKIRQTLENAQLPVRIEYRLAGRLARATH